MTRDMDIARLVGIQGCILYQTKPFYSLAEYILHASKVKHCLRVIY